MLPCLVLDVHNDLGNPTFPHPLEQARTRQSGPGQLSFPTFLRLEMDRRPRLKFAAHKEWQSTETLERHLDRTKTRESIHRPFRPRSNLVRRDSAAEDYFSHIHVTRGALERVQHDVTRENDGLS